MAIRRSDPRRRRVGVLLEDHDKAAVTTAATAADALPAKRKPAQEKTAKPATAYCGSARRRHLTKTSDLIPKRWLSRTIVALVIVFCVAAINVLYMYATQMTQFVGERAIEVFSLTQRGSLSQWFTTLLLIISGMASLQIYALRQHRSDDYRGTYRLWFWLAMLFLLASVDAAVGLHDLAVHAVSYFTGRSLSHGGWALITVKLIALTALVVRGCIEVRQSKGALVAVLFVWFAYAGATLMQLPQAQSGVVFNYEVAYGNLYLFGTVALFQSLVIYSRFVYMSAQGLIVAKTKAKAEVKTKTKSKTKAKAKSKTKSETKTKTKTTAKSKPKTTAQPEPVAKTKAELKAEAKAAAKAEAQAKAQAKATAKAEAQAKAKAAIEAKAATAKAEAIAKAKAEIERKAAAKAQAKADAKAAIEAKAKAKADAYSAKKATKQVAKTKPSVDSTNTPSASESEVESLPLSNKLSKREKKRQRKAKQQQRRAA